MSSLKPVVLLIEDELQIRHFVRVALENSGWLVYEAGTLHRGTIDAASRKPDLIILDLGLPDGDGQQFIRTFRTWSQVPVIVLSARCTELSKIDALDNGADDYLTKPFAVGELLARVRSAMRRHQQQGVDPLGLTRFGDVQIDRTTRIVTKAGIPVHLTPIEYRLLTILAMYGGQVVTTSQLMREVWGPSHQESSHYLRIYIGHLRQKLEVDPTQPRYFVTETGVGYRLLVSP